MNPTVALAEGPPYNSDDSGHFAVNHSYEEHGSPPSGKSPPLQKDATSSAPTAATTVTTVTPTISETAETPQRRETRRRTGPLTADQRERANLMRKIGVCENCRRKRTACHPKHRGMSWEEATKKLMLHKSPALAGVQLTPALPHSKPTLASDARVMDMDISPTQHHAQLASNEARMRTSLPSSPRPKKLANLPPLLGFEEFRAELQGSVNRPLASPFCSRYAHVSVLLVQWQDDDDTDAQEAIQALERTFHEDYNYTVQIKIISSLQDELREPPWQWLLRVVRDFVADHDQHNCLKIYYYSGYTYLNSDRDMVLASSRPADPASAIRWSDIQRLLEDARSDALVLLDCAYYPSQAATRRQGMLELIAASAGEDHMKLLGRSAFTRALTDQLRIRAVQQFKEPLSAAELHCTLLSLYSKMVQEWYPEREAIRRIPTPLIMQLSASKTQPSILLAPLRSGDVSGAPSPGRLRLSTRTAGPNGSGQCLKGSRSEG